MNKINKSTEKLIERIIELEHKLTNSEAMFHNIVERNLISILIINQEGEYVYLNPSALSLFDSGLGELLGERADLPLKEGYVRDFKVLNKNKREVLVDIYTSKIKWNGESAYLLSLKDITEQKRWEASLESLNMKLANKNKELEQFLFATSHDLRTPLVNIQGYSKFIGDELKNIKSIINNEDDLSTIKKRIFPILNKDIPEMFGYIHTSASKMGAFLSGVLQVSRLGQAKLIITLIDMNKLLPQLIKQFDFQINQNGAEIEVLKLPPCKADRAQTDQIFSNLIGNAMKYMSPARKVKITISGKVEKHQAIYCVKDNGIGIPKTAQEKIFNLFHQTHKGYKGEGIGLAIVQKIVRSHKGKVWVESEPDKGSKFYVSLPVKAEKDVI